MGDSVGECVGSIVGDTKGFVGESDGELVGKVRDVGCPELGEEVILIELGASETLLSGSGLSISSPIPSSDGDGVGLIGIKPEFVGDLPDAVLPASVGGRF